MHQNTVKLWPSIRRRRHVPCRSKIKLRAANHQRLTLSLPVGALLFSPPFYAKPPHERLNKVSGEPENPYVPLLPLRRRINSDTIRPASSVAVRPVRSTLLNLPCICDCAAETDSAPSPAAHTHVIINAVAPRCPFLVLGPTLVG